MARDVKYRGALSAEDFDRTVSKFPRMSEHAKALARAVLVDGTTYEQVTAQFEVSRQLASEWCLKVYRGFYPREWVTESITLPPERMEQVRLMQAQEIARWEAVQLKHRGA
jgi:hypothetical protein